MNKKLVDKEIKYRVEIVEDNKTISKPYYGLQSVLELIEIYIIKKCLNDNITTDYYIKFIDLELGKEKIIKDMVDYTELVDEY